MEHLAKIELIGRVANVSESIVGGQKHTRFGLGVDTVFNSPGGSMTKTSWFNCSYWGDMEKICTGGDIHLEGRMTSETYSDLNGSPRVYYEVKVNKIW